VTVTLRRRAGYTLGFATHSGYYFFTTFVYYFSVSVSCSKLFTLFHIVNALCSSLWRVIILFRSGFSTAN